MRKIVFVLFMFIIGLAECKAISSEAYYKTTYIDNEYIISKISKEEYDLVDLVSVLSSPVETEYKKMYINSSGNSVILNVEWKKTPKYKSYDVIALMSNDVTFNTNIILGKQLAILSDGTNIVNYNKTTQNTKLFNNGIGISMNLVNDAIYYNLTLSVNYNGSGKIYGNYRHAQSNVSLSESQNYYLSNGNIVFNSSSINNKYDSINPVWIDV